MTDLMEIKTHPVQRSRMPLTMVARMPCVVTLRAYEVYCYLYKEQAAMIEGSCRGGFGICEIVAFLYAYGFPKAEWRSRVDEALTGMEAV